jgi:tetratricopeptide (TPR) repeat protein
MMALSLDEKESRAERERCLEAAIRRDPDYVPARVAAVKHVIRALGDREGGCSEECTQVAERHLAVLKRLEPAAFEPLELGAQLELARGRPESAERLLAERCKALTEHARSACLELRVTVAAALPGAEPWATAVRDLLAAGCDVRGSCAKTYVWLGDLLTNREDWNGALGYYRRAARENSSPAIWRKVARAAEHVGAHAEAAAALARARGITGQH